MRITREGNRVTALIEGKLDTGTSPDFESAMRAQLDGADEIVLDFRDAIYVSSAGLRVILGLEKEMESSGGKMRMINLPEMVMEVFVETGLSEILNIERGRGMDYHIRDMSAPDVRIDGMPATQELWAREDPYDLPGTNEVFLEAVRENLRRHSGNAFYRDWLERNGFSVDDLETIDDISKIPPIHANFYKTHTVKTARDEDIAVTLTSSGTSGQKSQMFFDEWSMFASDKSCDVQMAYYGHITHEPANFLMYSYEPAEGVTTGTLRTRQAMRRYARENELVYALKYTGEGHEFDLFGCIEALERFEKEGLPVYILGFPAFLYFTLQKMEAMGKPPLRLDPRSFVCMGGGWKGFADRQLSSAEFREYAGARLGLPDSCFRETYGAVEHGVGYTDCAEHHFHVPIHDRVIIRDPRTLEPLGYGEKGFINFVSPMNTAVPVTSLLMGDFGILHEPGSCPCGNPSPWLEVVGRAGVSKNKSCAIAAAEMLKGGSK